MANINELATKKSLIDEIKKRLEDGIIEESNANLLIKLINNADDMNEAINIAALGTTYKRTGFHFDKRLEKMRHTIKYFKKNEKLSFSDGSDKPINKLIIGDNYDALQNLLIQYKGKIDVIYIDPPYGKDSMGEFAKTNYDNAITRDNLLSMLYNRLILARELLSDSGVIFCSIDDKNQAYIKCLMDEIFGETNFIATLCKKGTGGKQDSKTYSIIHEYVIAFAKIINNFAPGRDEKELTGYALIDEKGRAYKIQLLRKWGDNSSREDRPNLFYPIYYSEKNNKLSLEKNSKDDVEIYPIDGNSDGRWRWEQNTMSRAFIEGRVEIKKDKNMYIPYERLFKEEAINTKPFTTWLDDVKNDGTTILKQIFSEKVFDYPKSVDLIKRILSMIFSRDSIVLDFFAGSGTTGQAVLEMNKTDNGNRSFILCTNNEKTDLNPNGIAYDVTSKRLKRVMTGKCYDGNSDFEWIKNNELLGGSLDVYEISEVQDIERNECNNPFYVIDETLYGKEKFDSMNEKIKWVCENFEHTEKYEVE